MRAARDHSSLAQVGGGGGDSGGRSGAAGEGQTGCAPGADSIDNHGLEERGWGKSPPTTKKGSSKSIVGHGLKRQDPGQLRKPDQPGATTIRTRRDKQRQKQRLMPSCELKPPPTRLSGDPPFGLRVNLASQRVVSPPRVSPTQPMRLGLCQACRTSGPPPCPDEGVISSRAKELPGKSKQLLSPT